MVEQEAKLKALAKEKGKEKSKEKQIDRCSMPLFMTNIQEMGELLPSLGMCIVPGIYTSSLQAFLTSVPRPLMEFNTMVPL